MQRVVSVIAVIGVCFCVYAVWRNAHAREVRVRASWIRTPGVANPDVRQETIGQTICVRGWTRTVRPQTDYTNDLKARQMREYRLGGTSADYQEDHRAVPGNPRLAPHG